MTYTTAQLNDCYNTCYTATEEWFSYALQLEQEGQLDDAALALEEAILYEEDTSFWYDRTEIQHFLVIDGSHRQWYKVDADTLERIGRSDADLARFNGTDWDAGFEEWENLTNNPGDDPGVDVVVWDDEDGVDWDNAWQNYADRMYH